MIIHKVIISMRNFLLPLLLIIWAETAFAYDITASCSLTPEIITIKQPQNFGISNDLTRQTGSFERAKGETITLSGTIYDADCVPISDAKVYIWQPNYLGVYQNGEGDFQKYDKNFQGSGSFTTGNLGNFNFITVLPGIDNHYAPHINILVKHKDFYDFQTRIYFENQSANERDPLLHKYTTKSNIFNVIAKIDSTSLMQPQASNIQAYTLDLVLSNKNKYKKY